MDLKNVESDQLRSGRGDHRFAFTSRPQIKILQSDSLLDRVANKLDLTQERPESGWERSWRRKCSNALLGFAEPPLNTE